MITCKYTITKRVKDIETTQTLEVSDNSGYEKTAPMLLKELWDKFEQAREQER